MKKESSTETRLPFSAERPGSGPINGPPAQGLAESPIKSKLGATPGGSLHDAVRKGDTDLIKKLLQNGADTEEAAGEFSIRPLHLAACYNHKSTVECLLDRGANIEAKAPIGTALLLAAVYGHKSTVEGLLNRGANIEAKTPWGDTIPTSACCFIDKYPNKSELVSTIELLCSKRADVSVKNNKGESPLDYAIEVKNSKLGEELIGVLIRYGATVKVNDLSKAIHPRFIMKLADYQGGQERLADADASFSVEPDQRG